MNPTAFERADGRYVAPKNRAERRAREQFQARAERGRRRSRARIEQALQAFEKETS